MITIKTVHINPQNYNETDYIYFSIDWLHLKDYELKIFIILNLFQNNTKTLICSLKDIRNLLSIASSANNNTNIKKALANLSKLNYIDYNKEGHTYTIKNIYNNKDNHKTIQIKKTWITTFINHKEEITNISICWTKVLKVFIYILYHINKDQHLFTQWEIGNDLNISTSTVQKSLKLITQCKLDGISIHKQILKEHIRNNYTITKGSTYNIFIEFI